MAPKDDPDIVYTCTRCRKILKPGLQCPTHGTKHIRAYAHDSSSEEEEQAKTSSRKTKKGDKHSRHREQKSGGKSSQHRRRKDSSSSESDSSDESDHTEESERDQKSRSKDKKRHKSQEARRKVKKPTSSSKDASDISSNIDVEAMRSELEANRQMMAELLNLRIASQGASSSQLPRQTSTDIGSQVEDKDIGANIPKSVPSSTYSKAASRPVLPVGTDQQFPTPAQAAAAPPQKQIVLPKCDAEHPNEWPKDQQVYDWHKDGKVHPKWFPGHMCTKCLGPHPLETCGRFWECLTRKYDRNPNSKADDKCKKCIEQGHHKNAKAHKTESHGLMAPYDLPTNPLLSSLSDKSLQVYGRPWPDAALPYIPFHPYAYHPRKLMGQKPEQYPNLHQPFSPLKYGLMYNDGNAAGQISAIKEKLPYRSQSRVPPRPKSAKPPKPAAAKTGQIQAGGSGGPSSTPGWDGLQADPKLPNPFWSADKSAFPSDGFFNCIKECMDPDARRYCENLQFHSQQYAVVLQDFPKLEEKQFLVACRKDMNRVAWLILRPYAERWRPGWTPTPAVKKTFAEQFAKVPPGDIPNVTKLVKSQPEKDILNALEKAKASKARESVSLHSEVKTVQESAPGSSSSAPQHVKVFKQSDFALGRQVNLSKEVAFDLSLHKDAVTNPIWLVTDGGDVFTDEAYCQPLLSPKEPHHYAAHISAWRDHTLQCYKERDYQLEYLDSTFEDVVLPGLKALGATQEIVAAADELRQKYLEHCETLVISLRVLAEEKIQDDSPAAFEELGSNANAVFMSFDESVDEEINQFIMETDVRRLTRQQPVGMSPLWPELMGILLPGKLDMATSLPYLAWPEDVQFQITQAHMESQHSGNAEDAEDAVGGNNFDVVCP